MIILTKGVGMKLLAICLLAIVLIAAAAVFPGAGAWAEPVRIASIFALSGSAVRGNIREQTGVRLAVSEINGQGGILGRPVKLLEFDNLSSAIGSKVAAEKAVRAGVAAIIGPAWSTHALPAAEVAEKMGIPLVTPTSTMPGVTRTGRYIFRVCFTDPFQARILSSFARRDLNARTAVVLRNVASKYSMELAERFMGYFGEQGGRTLAVLDYLPDESGFGPMLASAKKADADVLFIPGHHEGPYLAALAGVAGIRAVPLGGDGWTGGVFNSQITARLRGAYFCTNWDRSLLNGPSRRFVSRYGFIENLDAAQALAYDAVMVTAAAIEKAGSVNPEKIRDALAETDHEGVTGRISFNQYGDPVKPGIIMKIDDDRVSFFKMIYLEE